MHFVYKMDNLFRSIRGSDENSSVTKGFHFFNLFELQTFCVFKIHHSKPHHQFGSFFFNIFSSLSNPLSDTPLSVFHCSNSSVVPSFVLPSLQFGYNPFL